MVEHQKKLTSYDYNVKGEELDQRDNEAIQLFTKLVGYLSKDPKITDAPTEIVQKILPKTYLHNEIYCQLMKQLTRNTDPESRRRGWRLFSFVIQLFPPLGVDMECVVETFLFKHGAENYIKVLHSWIFNFPISISSISERKRENGLESKELVLEEKTFSRKYYPADEKREDTEETKIDIKLGLDNLGLTGKSTLAEIATVMQTSTLNAPPILGWEEGESRKEKILKLRGCV